MTTTQRPEGDAPTVVEPAEPGTSATLVHGRPLRGYLTVYTLFLLAFTAIWGAVLGVLLANHVQLLELPRFFAGDDAGIDLQQLSQLRQDAAAGTVTPSADEERLLGVLGEYDAARTQGLAWISALGVALTMLVQPIVGVVSDRTRHRLGRRAPWILFGVLVGAVALVGMRFAPTIAILGLLFAVAQVTLNIAQAPVLATVADRVQPRRRGTASALGGFGNFFGGTLGGVGAGMLFASMGLDIYFALAALVVLAAVLFLVVAKDRSSLDLAVPAHNWKDFFLGFTVALRSRDYRWVWIARVIMTFGYTVSTTMAIFMLQSYISPTLSAEEATMTAPLLSFAGLPFTIVTLFIAGRLSDKLGRRKVFVIAASALMAASMLIPMFSATLPALFAQVIVAGIAYGAYLPVDQALFIDVLPDQRSAGRDLGVAGLGTNLGQAAGPLLASAVVTATGSYFGIWAAALVLVALAAVAILPVRAR